MVIDGVDEVGPVTVKSNVPLNVPDCLMILRLTVFSLTNSQSMSSIGPIVTSTEVGVPVATVLLSASVHITDTNLQPVCGSTSDIV